MEWLKNEVKQLREQVCKIQLELERAKAEKEIASFKFWTGLFTTIILLMCAGLSVAIRML